MSQGNSPIYGDARSGSAPHHLLQEYMRQGRPFSGHERNCAFLNMGDGIFADIAEVAGLGHAEDGRSIGLTDWDGDGDIDLWLKNRNGPQIRYLENQVGARWPALTLELVGTRSQRDAVGARIVVEVSGAEGHAPQRLIRTLRAGEGFLAQSSKRIVVGLGNRDEVIVRRVTVRWPVGGQAEEFTGVDHPGAFRLVEGTGEATPLPQREERKLQDTVEPLGSRDSATATEHPTRLLLSEPLPTPPLRLRDERGGLVPLRELGSAPKLVCLWAEWCKPCLEELKALAREKEILEASGVQVVLVRATPSTDQAASDRSISAKELLSSLLGEESDTGFVTLDATPEMLERIQVLQDWLFFRTQTLALPTSLLLDASGDLRGFYRGSVAARQIVEDRKKTALPAEARRTAVLPIEGRWSHASRPHRTLWVAAQVLEQGSLGDAVAYVDAHAAAAADDPDLADARLRLGTLLLQTGQTEAAVRQLRQAISLRPDHTASCFALGSAFEVRGDRGEADRWMQKAAARSPEEASHLHREWASVLLAAGRSDLAAKHLARAGQLQPDDAAPIWELIRLELKTDRAPEAIAHLRRLAERGSLRANALIAWVTMTSPDGRVRDRDAARDALDVIRPDPRLSPLILADLEAAGHAQGGRYEAAFRTLRDARSASPAIDAKVLRAIEQRQAVYASQQPYRGRHFPEWFSTLPPES